MKAKLTTLILLLFSITSLAQIPSKQNDIIQQKQIPGNANYQLFPTKNYWTFLKLDTRNGKIWQVHFTVNEDGGSAEVVLSDYNLAMKGKEVSGRFTLHPTENIYNFLLLDQIEGHVYQVQWSMEEKNRIVLPILSKK